MLGECDHVGRRRHDRAARSRRCRGERRPPPVGDTPGRTEYAVRLTDPPRRRFDEPRTRPRAPSRHSSSTLEQLRGVLQVGVHEATIRPAQCPVPAVNAAGVRSSWTSFLHTPHPCCRPRRQLTDELAHVPSLLPSSTISSSPSPNWSIPTRSQSTANPSASRGRGHDGSRSMASPCSWSRSSTPPPRLPRRLACFLRNDATDGVMLRHHRSQAGVPGSKAAVLDASSGGTGPMPPRHRGRWERWMRCCRSAAAASGYAANCSPPTVPRGVGGGRRPPPAPGPPTTIVIGPHLDADERARVEALLDEAPQCEPGDTGRSIQRSFTVHGDRAAAEARCVQPGRPDLPDAGEPGLLVQAAPFVTVGGVSESCWRPISVGRRRRGECDVKLMTYKHGSVLSPVAGVGSEHDDARHQPGR